MGTFKLTAEMLNGYCQNGLTVEEMANAISEVSGIKCSVNQVRKACKHYNISLRAKPRKNVFVLDNVENSNTNEVVETTETVGELAEVNV